MKHSFFGSVLVARHGQTPSNVARRYAGRSNEGLNDVGREQARALSVAVRHLGITRLRTSPITRAAETAAIVGMELDVPVLEDERLTELRMGPWEGLTEAEVSERFPREYLIWCERPDRLRIEGRETLWELADRVEAALVDSVESEENEFIVTHVAIVRVALLVNSGRSLGEYRQIQVPNCQPVRIPVVGTVERSNGSGLGDATRTRGRAERGATAKG